MKKTALLLLLLLLLLCVIQYCYAMPFKISGKINSRNRPYVVFHYQDLLGVFIRIDTIKLNVDGSFNHVLEFESREFHNIYLEIDSSHNILLLGSGNSALDIEFNAANGESIFNGPMAKIQQFGEVDRIYWKKIYSGYVTRNPKFEEKLFEYTDDYFEIQDSITEARIKNLSLFFKGTEKEIELAFINYRKTSFIYNNLYYKQSYENADFKKYKFYQVKFKVGSAYTYRYSDLVTFDDPNICSLNSYKEFVNTFIIKQLLYERKSNKEGPFVWSKLIPNRLSLIDKLSSNNNANERLKRFFLISLLDELERNKDGSKAAEMMKEINHLAFKNDSFIQEMNKRLYSVINNKFKQGNQAPDFEFIDQLGAKLSLSDFKGKRLVIDIAASWCGPCIAGIPLWNKKVEDDFDKQTVYVFLSLDDTRKESIELFQKHQPKGLLLFAGDGGFKSKFAKLYEISSLPNQIIIDKQGKIESYAYH